MMWIQPSQFVLSDTVTGLTVPGARAPYLCGVKVSFTLLRSHDRQWRKSRPPLSLLDDSWVESGLFLVIVTGFQFCTVDKSQQAREELLFTKALILQIF
jgi:hypothetical protein